MEKMRIPSGVAVVLATLSFQINAASTQGLYRDALRARAVKEFGGLATLNTVPVPKPSAATALGKAFYWIAQASSHFAAGADNRKESAKLRSSGCNQFRHCL